MTRRRFYLWKHVFDALLAATLLLLLAPLMGSIALLILAIDGRPVIFRQMRPGLNGRPFTIFKFRTMRISGGDDRERLTWWGTILRATSLDELPELINVLRGEMSLVGPRPLLMQYLERYSPQQKRRHEVRPGITGLAQISGRNELDWESRFELDVWYVDHGSFWLDLKILAVTLVKVLQREGLNAPNHATMPEFMGSASRRAPGSVAHTPLTRTLRLSGKVFAGAAIAQLLTAACVAAIDPYGVIGLVNISGLNATKTQRMEEGGRVERSVQLWRSDFDTLILGGSRAWVGLDPAGPALRNMDAYNAAVPDPDIREIVAIGRFALREQRPKRVIIGLSFSMFEEHDRPDRDFEESGFDGDPMPVVIARTTMEPSSVRDAIKTVRDNIRGVRAPDLSNGLHVRLHPDGNYRKAFDDVLIRHYLVKPWEYADFQYDTRGVNALRQLVTEFVASGADVYLFVAPVHARQLEAMAAMGVYPTFERWLGDMTEAIASAGRDPAASGKVALWDFTGFTGAAAEEIPRSGSERPMRWFWNSALYTPALGEKVLARMLDRPCACPGFGQKLEPSTIKSMLAAKRDQREAYRAQHPFEVAEIQRLVRETEPLRQRMWRRFEKADDDARSRLRRMSSMT